MDTWIYLSPHLDDGVFSCGGLIHAQAAVGHAVEVWTICAGDPPVGPLSPFAQALHARWGLDTGAAALRREEDRRACAALGASCRHFDLPDCIYRLDPANQQHLYPDESAIFGEVAGVEIERLVPDLAAELEGDLPRGARLAGPLALGGHVDHRLVRMVLERLDRPAFYFADAPYVFAWEEMLPESLPAGARMRVEPLREGSEAAWLAGNAAYGSQISTFWESPAEMGQVFRDYARQHGGVRLWQVGGEPLPGFEPRSRT